MNEQITTKTENFENCIAHNLSVLLKERELTCNELGRKLGIPAIALHKLKSGEQTNPTLNTLYPISQFFGLSIDQLVKVKM